MLKTEEARPARPVILLIEDNPGDVELLRLALRMADLDCDLTVLTDGGEAMAMVRRQGAYREAPEPDLAILDLNIPKNDGVEVLETMRASEVFKNTRVV